MGKAIEAVEGALAQLELELGHGVEELLVDAELLRRLEAECAPCSVEEYFGLPILTLPDRSVQ